MAKSKAQRGKASFVLGVYGGISDFELRSSKPLCVVVICYCYLLSTLYDPFWPTMINAFHKPATLPTGKNSSFTKPAFVAIAAKLFFLKELDVPAVPMTTKMRVPTVCQR